VTGLPRSVAFQRRPLTTLIEAQRTAGDSFPMRTLIGGRMWVVAEPTLADEVLRAPPGRYRAGSANRLILPALPDDSVLTLDGEAHRTRRRVLAPLFRGESLALMTPIIREIAAVEIASWPVGVPFALLPRTRFVTRTSPACASTVTGRTACSSIATHRVARPR
jgi:cytochrome P450